MDTAKRVAIVGGGPAGLMAAHVLGVEGVHVDLYEAMPSVGRRLLAAGSGGLNLTHSERLEDFVPRYGKASIYFQELLEAFSPTDLREFVGSLGIETEVGSSGRVFPTDFKAGPLLRSFVRRLRELGVLIHTRHRFVRFGGAREPVFARGECEEIGVPSDAVLLALGGASWRRLGSDGVWSRVLGEAGVKVNPFQPSNCGFEVRWTQAFRDRFEGKPLKNLVLRAGSEEAKGELMLTKYGVEGGGVYALSAPLRTSLAVSGHATLVLDLKKDKSVGQLETQLQRPRGKRSMKEHLRREARIDGATYGLLREFATQSELENPRALARLVKELPLPVSGVRPLDESISTAGGVAFDGVDDQLMLRALPGVFVAGEMLDWEAPTGGYLLQGAFSTGVAAARGILHWLARVP